jgi:hypothetical protein
VPVYILQEGQSNIFKIGRTSGNVEDVVRTLHRGNSQPLSLFDVVVTDQESACEAFFHRRLRSKRVARGGGREFFELEPVEMRQAISTFRRMFEELEAARCAISELSGQQSTDRLLDPIPEDEQLLNRLIKNKEEQEYLRFECELIESKLKQRIGTAAGLRGIATWKTQLTRRFNESLFRASDRERYELLLERYHRLDTAAWKSARPEEYKSVQTTYFTPHLSRAFRPEK